MKNIHPKLPRIFNHTVTVTFLGIVLVFAGSIVHHETREAKTAPAKLQYSPQNTIPETDAFTELLSPGTWQWGQMGFSVSSRVVSESELAIAQSDLGQDNTGPASALEEATLEWLKLSGSDAVKRRECLEYTRTLAVGSLRVVATQTRIRLAQIIREETPGQFQIIQITPGQATVSQQVPHKLLPPDCPIVATRHTLTGEVSAWLIGPVHKSDFLKHNPQHTGNAEPNTAFSMHMLSHGYVWFFSTSRGTFGLVIPQKL